LPPLLCRLGMHKWRDYGESVLIVWKEPGFIPGVKTERRKNVLSLRECPRCGVKQKRIFSENIDGTMAAVGWEIVE
jgi:hypothetical protein